mgnify:CR=1 FL=1
MPVYQREVCANGFIAYIVDTVRIFASNFFALAPIYIINLNTLMNEPFFVSPDVQLSLHKLFSLLVT